MRISTSSNSREWHFITSKNENMTRVACSWLQRKVLPTQEQWWKAMNFPYLSVSQLCYFIYYYLFVELTVYENNYGFLVFVVVLHPQQLQAASTPTATLIPSGRANVWGIGNSYGKKTSWQRCESIVWTFSISGVLATLHPSRAEWTSSLANKARTQSQWVWEELVRWLVLG